MFVLPPWGRWAMIGGAIAIVCLTALVVVCVVVPGCLLNNIFLNDDEEQKRKGKKENDALLEKRSVSGEVHGPKEVLVRDNSSVSQSTQSTPSNGVHSKACEKNSYSSVETSSLLSSLADSTYSSMSEYSGRSSPTGVYHSGPGSCTASGTVSPVIEGSPGQLSFGIQYISNTHDVNIGKLVITVLEASDLSGKEYLGTSCDPYVKVAVSRERRSLRKNKSSPVSTFRTRTVRHSRSPTFNQSFIMDADKTQLKDLVIKMTVMDQDKWASPSTVGEIIQPLREIKNLSTNDQRTTLNYCLGEPKLDLGEMLFGLSYLPTAQRLTVSIVKASNLRYQNLVDDLSDFHPFVRVILISSSGRLLKKKKTGWRSGTIIPVWNETLVFDLTQAQMENIIFLLVVCTKHLIPLASSCSDASYQSSETLPDVCVSSEDSDQGPQKNDKYLGKVVLGSTVKSEDAKNHWNGILANPRKVTSQWHPLK